MLTAIRENGSRICLADYNQSTLLEIRSYEKFFCPYCKDRMHLKIGVKKITHFAHYRNSSCGAQFENESEYHLMGKQKLYLWLKRQGLEPELEVYDKSINQRPDIRFTLQQQRYAVEFQCSTIPESLFMQRTKSYLNNDYHPLWILGGNQFSRKCSNIATLSEFQYLFLNITKNGDSLLRYYCPNQDRFILLKQIIPVSVRKTVATVIIKTPAQTALQEILTPQCIHSPPIRIWQKEIRNFKNFYSLNPNSHQDPFLKALYTNLLHIAYLPPEIGLPVPHSAFIRTPPVIWQGFLYLDQFLRRGIGETFTFETIYMAFKKRMKKRHITLRTIPNIHECVALAVLEYLNLLTHCNYLTKINENTYRINYHLVASRNMVEQEQKEILFYNHFIFQNNNE